MFHQAQNKSTCTKRSCHSSRRPQQAARNNSTPAPCEQHSAERSSTPSHLPRSAVCQSDRSRSATRHRTVIHRHANHHVSYRFVWVTLGGHDTVLPQVVPRAAVPSTLAAPALRVAVHQLLLTSFATSFVCNIDQKYESKYE